MEAVFNYLFDETAWKVLEWAFPSVHFASPEMERETWETRESLWDVVGAQVGGIVYVE